MNPLNKQIVEVLKSISKHDLPESFTYTDDSPRYVLDRLVLYLKSNELDIRPYYFKNPFSRVIGFRRVGSKTIYYNPKRVHEVYNSNKFCALVVHEVLHILGYGHGNNCIKWYCNGRKKMRSANYWFSNNYARFAALNILNKRR